MYSPAFDHATSNATDGAGDVLEAKVGETK